MSRPIEVGAIVLIISAVSEYHYLIGSTGTVILYDEEDDDFNVKSKFGVLAYKEHQLKRIDDDKQELSTWEAVAKDCKWNPNEVTA